MITTHALLLFAVGVTLYAGFFHWALQRHLRAGRWLTAWSALAALFAIARTVQLASDLPETVVWSARVYTAIAPLLVWTMLRFLLDLANQTPGPRARGALAATALGLSALALTTPWFASNEIISRHGLFGEPVLSVRSGPAFVLFGFGLLGGLAWALAALARASTLPAAERRVLIACMSLYGALAASSVLSALGWSPLPGVAEFGPLVVSIGTSHLIASRERDLARNLSTLVDEHTAALRASEERYRRLVEHAPIGVLACDANGDVVAATKRFREILNLRTGEGPLPLNLIRDIPERARPHLEILKRALDTGEVVSGELPYVTWAGKHVELKVVIAPKRAPDGSSLGALVMVEDVTERRAVEARLRQSLKLEAIGQLAAGIAVGISAPMTEVRGHLAGMRAECEALRKHFDGSSEDQARLADLEELIDDSCEGVERAIGIVRDMRELSRGGSVAIEPVDLNALLHSVVRMAATQRKPGVDLVERYAELPPIVGNAGQLQQVFLNLVVNALQAVRTRGRIEVESAPDGDGVSVRVRDDGPGIAPQDRERLFVPFFTTKPAGEGTGLGLFLSYQIVQAHRGEIRVHSRPGLGATFEVWLPRERRARGAAA